ncbi:unnamed protein product, partial [Ectocarpus sp. 4 AP-2014]
MATLGKTERDRMPEMSAVGLPLELGPSQELGLVQELGLHGVPAQSLIEFEGGGSMLSREVLGEMLAVNDHGILKARVGATEKSHGGRSKWARRREGASSAGSREKGSDCKAVENRIQTRLLCQAEAPKCLGESSSSPSRVFAKIDPRKSTKRCHNNGVESRQRHYHDQQALLAEQRRAKHSALIDGDRMNHRRATATAHFEALTMAGSPNKRRRHKRYDHDHNPKVLRSLVDDTIITGIAGAGALKADEGRQMEDLRLQLRLACHRATELEDQIFQSQTGSPHRELLGELQLDRAAGNTGIPLLERPGWKERNFVLDPTGNGAKAPRNTDVLERCRSPDGAGWRSPLRTRHRVSPGKTRRTPLDVSFSTGPPQRLAGSSTLATDIIPRRQANVSDMVTTCHPSQSPPLTPTASLRRYLSSLRPFSANSSRAAWGLADPANGGNPLAGPVTDLTHPFDNGQPRWPVLFVMGGSKPPPPRHPLSVHALPLFDDEMVALLAGAAGEPAEKVRMMVQLLSRFDVRLLQSAVKRLCCEHARSRTLAVAARGGTGRHLQQSGAPGPATEAWGRSPMPPLPGPSAAGDTAHSSTSVDEPLLMSEAAAGRALTAGFLGGVFGEDAVRDIVVASRPVVVFDSTESAKGEALMPPLKGGAVGGERQNDWGDRPEGGSSRAPSWKIGKYAEQDSSGRGGEDQAAATAANEDLTSSLPSVEHRRTREGRNGSSVNPRAQGDSPPCTDDGLLLEKSPRQAPDTALGKRQLQVSELAEHNSNPEEGVLVAQLVRAATARFRVHSLAVQHHEHGGVTATSRRDFGRGIYIGGSGASGWTEGGQGPGQRLRRPASAGSDELGLPPLKLARKDKRTRRRREADAGRREEEVEFDVFGVPRPRSTPRCLRPGYKGEVTAAMLRQELEASESTAARLGITMARKAEAWKTEAQEGTAAASASSAAANRAALALASAAAHEALLESAHDRMREAMNVMYLRTIRRGWGAWAGLTRRQRSTEAAGRVARLVGAAAIGFAVLEPLLRRRTRTWLRRWAGAMRAERVLEVQAAAVELQRTVRGFLGKRRADKRRRDMAAVAVQRVMRGRFGRLRGARRARMMEERRAVLTIEQKYREFVWQRDAVKLLALKRKERAATKLQAAWSGLVYGRRPVRRLRERRLREVSAVMLQRLWRGVVARGRADVLMEAKYRREAAVKIQALARGHGARKAYRPIILRERAATIMSRFWRCAKARRVARQKRWENALAARLNPLVRGFLARRAMKRPLEERARENRAMVVACVAVQKMFRGKQGRLKARRELLRRCAAVELQRIVRGRAVRRLSRIEEGRPRSQTASWMAAMAVQRMWRGLKGRRKLGQRAAEHRLWNAAFTIQSAHRRQRMRRRRRERTLKRGMEVANAAAASSQGLGHAVSLAGATAAVAAAAEGGDDAGRRSFADTTEQAGQRAAGDGAGEGARSIDRLEGAAGTGSGATAAHGGTAGGPRVDGPPAIEVKVAPTPEYEDMGDVAIAAVLQSAGKSSTPPSPPPSPPVPVPVPVPAVVEPVLVPAKPADPLPPVVEEEMLEYYEAKLRYLAAQEKAHGASAARIQASATAMFRAYEARQRAATLGAEMDKVERRKAAELRAASVLQSAARTRAARRAVARRRAEILEATRREQGLLTIQCAVRCYVGRCRLQGLRKAERERQEMLFRMAARVQALVRGIQTRDIWRKFFTSRALLQRERQRTGAQHIQSFWRSKLARTEAERRRSVRDAALLAEQLESRHLKGLLEATMEAERRHAYAIRLQCWWRGILAVKVMARKQLTLIETPPEDVGEEKEKAALVLQCHWRAIKARRFYNANYALLYRERERRKCCTECQSEYATRKCDTCTDKFCEGCWARIHSTGARRFHDWLPFAPASYNTSRPQDAAEAPSTTDSQHYYHTSTGQQGAGGGELWDANQQSAELDPYYQPGYESYDYPGSEYYYGQRGWEQEGGNQQDSAVSVQGWSPETNQQWYDPDQPPSTGSEYGYDGAMSYDGAAAITPSSSSDYYPAWTPETSDTAADNNNNAAGTTVKSWEGEGDGEWTSAAAEYYGYDSAGSGVDQAAGGAWAGAGGVAGGWDEGWATPQPADTANGDEDSSVFLASTSGETSKDSGGGSGGVGGAPPSGSSGSRPWSVNEYGQRVAGDWVEYWDDAAQAAYFYNTASGEASDT